MAYCETTFLGTNTYFNSSTVAVDSVTSTFLYEDGNEIIFASEKSKSVPAQVVLVAKGNEYDLTNPVTFNESISFRIKVYLNGTTESFDVNIMNGSCDNQSMMTVTVNYEGI